MIFFTLVKEKNENRGDIAESLEYREVECRDCLKAVCRAEFHDTNWVQRCMVLFLLLVLVVVVFFDLGYFGLGFFVLFLLKPWSLFSEASLHLFIRVLNGIGSCTEFNVSISI